MNYQTAIVKGALKWPYPVDYDAINIVNVDVLVVGGSFAGCSAGISAARRGMRVAVADKAPIKRSGCGGAGMDHWNVVLETPNSPLSTEKNVESILKRIPILGHRDYIAMKGTWDALMELKRLGLPLCDNNDDFIGTPTRDEGTKLLKAYDYQSIASVKLRGGHFIKPVLHEGLKAAGALLFDRVMITALLTDGGKQGARIVGATGFSMETGEFYVFHAKSVVIASGYVSSCWIFSLELAGNIYRWDPNDVGEGLAMAWNAGAQVYGMHRGGNTSGSHPFSWPRFCVGNTGNSWFPCTIVDNKGREIPWEYPDGTPVVSVEERTKPGKEIFYTGFGPSAMPYLIRDLGERIRKGEYELPLWADLSGMQESERRSIWGIMVGNEGKTRYPLFDYFTREGFDPDKDMLMAPLMDPESYTRFDAWYGGEPDIVKPWRTERGSQGEIVCDWNLMTNIGGLFCAGAASGLESSSLACSSGFYAGNRAAEYCQKVTPGEVDNTQIEVERERVYAPARRRDTPGAYVSWKEVWAGTCRVMQQCCGDYKTVPILEHGLLWLDSIKNHEMSMTYARNPHELARVFENETRLTCSQMYIKTCIAKIEADNKGIGRDQYMFCHQEDGKIVSTFKDPLYWLKEPYAPTYLENYRATDNRYMNETQGISGI